jgi:hypothetical protein
MFQTFIFVALISLSYCQRPSFLPAAIISCVADGNHVSYHRNVYWKLFVVCTGFLTQLLTLNNILFLSISNFYNCSALPITIVAPQIVQQVDVQQAALQMPQDHHHLT